MRRLIGLVLGLVTGVVVAEDTLTWDPEPAVYDIDYTWTLKGGDSLVPGSNPATLLILGVPTSNEFQTIDRFSASVGQLEFDSVDHQPYWAVSGPNFPRQVKISFRATLRRAWADFASLTDADFDGSIKPTGGSDYLGSGFQVDPNYPAIRAVADQLWQTSSSIPDFIRRAYLWQQKTIPWGPRGFSSLDDLFRLKTGDCGNQTILFLSLLRTHNIPCRFLMGYVLKDTNELEPHVWPEFFAGAKGWIPADTSNYVGQTTAYLGFYDGLRLFHTRTDHFSIDRDGFQFNDAGLQTYGYWYRDFSAGQPSWDSRVTAHLVSPRTGQLWQTPDFLKNLLRVTRQALNDKRQQSNLPALHPDETLIVAANLLANPTSPEKKKADKNLGAWLKGQGYAARSLYFQNFVTADAFLAPWQAFFDSLKATDPALGRAVQDWGLGHFYDSALHQHHFFLLTATKN